MADAVSDNSLGAQERPADVPEEDGSVRPPDECEPEPVPVFTGESGLDSEDVIRKLDDITAEFRGLFASIQTRLDAVESVVRGTDQKVGYVPPQVRQLTDKVNGLATAISEPRLRDALKSLLGVYDMVDHVLRALPDGGDDAQAEIHRRNYDAIRSQILQILTVNGLYRIDAGGAFDSKSHMALESVPTDDSALNGNVKRVVREGFRTDQAVLRYAEVEVWKCGEPAAGGQGETQPERESEPTPTAE